MKEEEEVMADLSHLALAAAQIDLSLVIEASAHSAESSRIMMVLASLSFFRALRLGEKPRECCACLNSGGCCLSLPIKNDIRLEGKSATEQAGEQWTEAENGGPRIVHIVLFD